jgi:hypothetical protein
MNKNNLFIAIIVFFIFFLMVCYSCAKPFVPFSFDTLKRHQYPYQEGFAHGQVGYSTVSENLPIDTGINHLKNKSNVECKKVAGFDGLFCAPYVADAIIDPLFAVESNMTCPGSGLTKSGGNVCLNKTQTQLLTTRGGNATGGNFQIGN